MRAFSVPLILLFATAIAAQPPAKAAKKDSKKGYTDAQLIAAFEQTSPTRVVERRRLAGMMGARTSPALRAFCVRAVRKDRDVSVRTGMMRCLLRTPDKEVREVFEKQLAKPGVSLGEKRYVIKSLKEFSFNWRSRLVRFVAENDHATLRREAVVAIAKARDAKSLKALRHILARDDKLLPTVLIALRSAAYPIGEIYREFIAPHVAGDSGVAARLESIRCLGRARDARFHRFARAFADDGGTAGTLNGLISEAARFGDVEAGVTMMRLAVAGGVGTAGTLERSLAKLKGPEVQAWLIKRGLSHSALHIRRAAVKVIAKSPTLDAVKPLQALTKDADLSLAIEAVRTLGAIGGPEVRQFLRKRWGAKDPFVAAAALEASYRVEKAGEEVVAALVSVARRSRSWQLRLVAIQVLKKNHAMAMFDDLKLNAAHKRDQVRAQSYDALTYVRTKDCVDFLIARLFHEKGRARFDLADALLDLTGFDYGIRSATWRSWWARVREGYTLPPKPKKRRRSAPPAGYASYYGIPVRSNRVAFVIDTSGSMAPTGGTGKKSKMQRAKENLIATVKAFGSKVGFTVVAFSSGNRLFERELIRATKGNKRKAEAWVLDLAPGGGTELFGALLQALDVRGVDTLFVLSDGAPTGTPSEILRIITERNRFDRVRINTIGIQVGGATAQFMRDLAEQNFGEFVSR